MTGWMFLTNHAQVLLAIARNNRSTAKEIATQVGITERAVQRILDDLEEAGCISRFRDGRKNRYEIHFDAALRHPAQHGYTIRDLITTLTAPES
jgi:DNA-binding IclR family transcriptional regulator